MPYRNDPYLHCRFCDWKTLRFAGKRMGTPKLDYHVKDKHMDELLTFYGCATWDEYAAQQEALNALEDMEHP